MAHPGFDEILTDVAQGSGLEAWAPNLGSLRTLIPPVSLAYSYSIKTHRPTRTSRRKQVAVYLGVPWLGPWAPELKVCTIQNQPRSLGKICVVHTCPSTCLQLVSLTPFSAR